MQKSIYTSRQLIILTFLFLFVGLRSTYSQGFSGPYDPANWTYNSTGWYDLTWTGDPPVVIFLATEELNLSVIFPDYCGPFTLGFTWDHYTEPPVNITDYEIYYKVNSSKVVLDPMVPFVPPFSINPLDTFTFGVKLIVPNTGQWISAGMFDFIVHNNDTTPPVSLLPDDITIPANTNCVGEMNFLPDSFSFHSLFTDPDCATYTVHQLEGLGPWDEWPIGSTLNIFQAIDGNGNMVLDSFTVTVVDTGLIIPAMQDLPLIYGPCHATVTDTPTAIENCTGLLLTGTTNDPLVYHNGGIYTITWSYEGSQSNIITQTQTVVVIEGCIGLEETNINTPTVFPNPSNGFFRISFPEIPDVPADVRLVDMVGRTVYTTQSHNNLQEINLTHLPATTYYLIISYNDQVFTQPIIIQ